MSSNVKTKTRKRVKIHPDIAPALARALQRIRARFVKTPSAFDGEGPWTFGRCGCIVAWLKKETRHPDFSSDELAACYPKSETMIISVFRESSYGNNKANTPWAIKRIDKMLATNT